MISNGRVWTLVVVLLLAATVVTSLSLAVFCCWRFRPPVLHNSFLGTLDAQESRMSTSCRIIWPDTTGLYLVIVRRASTFEDAVRMQDIVLTLALRDRGGAVIKERLDMSSAVATNWYSPQSSIALLLPSESSLKLESHTLVRVEIMAENVDAFGPLDLYLNWVQVQEW